METNCGTSLESLSLSISNFNPTNINEAMTIAISMIMQDYNYILIGNIDFQSIPFLSHYKLIFQHHQTENINYNVYLVSMPRMLSIHACVSFENDAKYKCMLQIVPDIYISMNDLNQVNCNKNTFSELQRIYIDSICRPFLQFVLKEKMLPELPDLSNMPYQIQVHIIKLLCLKDLTNLALVNKQWHHLSKDPYIWRHKYLSKYSQIRDKKMDQDWLQLFKEKYISEKQQANFCSHHGVRRPPLAQILHPPIFDPYNLNFPEIIPRLPPFMIGGRDDLIPRLPTQPDIIMNNLNGDFEIGRLIHSSVHSPFYRSNLH